MSGDAPGDGKRRPRKRRTKAGGAGHGPRTASERAGVRGVALELLAGTEESGEFIDDALARALGNFDERDRHLLQEVTYGTSRHRNTLDRLAERRLELPMAGQRAPVRWAIRVGAYQLVYLSRIPAHAALDGTLEGMKRLQGVNPAAVGFVNAVLRKIAGSIRKKTLDSPLEPDDPTVIPIREGYCHFDAPVLPLRRLDPAGHLALRHSHPAWLVQRWLARLGEEETIRLCEAGNRTPAVTARVTRAAPSREELIRALEAEGLEPGPGNLPGSVMLRRAGDLARSETFRKGWFRVQDETAIQIGDALAPPPGARVLDLCAAPGGKTAQLLEAVGPGGRVVAVDRSEERLTLVRSGLPPFEGSFAAVAVPDDPAAIDLGETFSHVLVDAPCSNTGVLARRPEARWRVRPGDLASLAKLQSALLAAGLRHLEPGGRIVYATCSIEPEENEEIAARAFSLEPSLVELGTKLFLPHRTPGDGGFYSLLLRPR